MTPHEVEDAIKLRADRMTRALAGSLPGAEWAHGERTWKCCGQVGQAPRIGDCRHEGDFPHADDCPWIEAVRIHGDTP